MRSGQLPPPPLRGLDQLVDHRQTRLPGAGSLGYVGPRSYRSEDGLYGVGGPQVPPMLRRIVVEGEKCLFVGGDLLERLGPLHPELGSERLDGLYGLFLVLGTGDLLD